MSDDFVFLYWDETPTPQKEIQNTTPPTPCTNHATQQEEDEEDEARAEYRMWVIMRNGNSGEHYFDYFNNHKSSAEIYDDEEELDIE